MSTLPEAASMHEVDYDPFASSNIVRAVPTIEAQREIWLASQLGDEASLAYNESVSLRLVGRLDPQALERALGAVVERHESLRATLSADGLDMTISESARIPLRTVDLRHVDEAARSAALDALLAAEVETPFDLVEGPLFRATLVRLSAERSDVILTGHHVVCDGWSIGVVATELMALYSFATGADGHGSTLPPSERFSDFAERRLSDEHRRLVDVDTRWWLEQYDAGIPVLDLPLDRPRPAVRAFASRREDLRIDAALVEDVKRAGAASGASLFVTLLAMFGAMLGRLSGQTEVVVGVPAAGQVGFGNGRLVGHCVQLLPIRVPADPESGASAQLERVRVGVLDAWEHQACTFGELLKKLRVERDPSRPPLVSVVFNLDAALRSEALSAPGLTVELSGNARRFENFDLFLNVTQSAGELVLECQYGVALFDADTIRRWLELYRAALVRFSADPSLTVAACLAPSERDVALLERFNATGHDHDRSLTVTALIERQVRATPDAVSVSHGGHPLTYGELWDRAGRVAAVLHARGVRHGDLVGLHCSRGADMVVALLGILRAGAGYVPMDPAFPVQRLKTMVVDSGARVVLCDAVARLPEDLSRIDRIDVAIAAAGGHDSAGPESLTNGEPGDVAYVIYTSGSTGRPKGVRVPHRSVVNLLASVAREPGMTAADTVLSVTTLSFDIAVSEVVLPLTVGARIVVADASETVDGDRLRALIERERVTFIDATPSTWRLLLDAGWPGGPGIRAICTGEPLPPELGRALLPKVSELWNGYGPTETTVWSTFHHVTSADGPLPIGHPIANTRIDVVDAALRPLPVGVVGELLIGGEGVTLGYHGRPDLTEERFVPDPLRPQAMRYRTGDLGRWRSDGTLECLGRTDHQVKVRGYRIELGEIEAALGRLPLVSRAVVMRREDEADDVRLVAYVESADAGLDPERLRHALRASLPEYMIPHHVVRMAALPLLPNGKIDRGALPAPGGLSRGRAPRVAPRTDVEIRVVAAMEAVLKLPGLGLDDDFFLLGGHSLLATRLAARLGSEFGVAVPLRTVFEAPDAKRLSAAILASIDRPRSTRRAIARSLDEPVSPLTVMQDRIRFVESLHPGRVTYNAPSAHRLRGPLDVAALERAFRELVARQPVLRTRIETIGDAGVQRVQETVDVSIPLVDLGGVEPERREEALMLQMRSIVDRPIDIHRAPLFRVALYRLRPDEHVLLFMPHHIIWDGWSFDLLYRELSELYPAALEGRPHALPPLPVTYGDFARWQASWIDSEECRAQLDHWVSVFSRVRALRPLPTDRPRQAGMSGAGAIEWIRIERELVDELRTVATAAGATLNMLLITVYAATLSEMLSGAPLVLGVPVRGRAIEQLETVMGFFNNLLPLPLVLDPNDSIAAGVAAVRVALLEGFANQDVPFEHIAAEPTVAALAGKAGLYQSLFSFQDARERERRWGPLTHESVMLMQRGATEDIGLWLMEVPGGLEGGLNYNADLFDASTAVAVRDRLLGLLRRVARGGWASFGELLADPGSDAATLHHWVSLRDARPPERRDATATASEPRPAPVPEGSATEQAMRTQWATLLGIEPGLIEPGDNFFDLGGNSLQAMRCVEAMERASGRRIEPRRYVFESLRQLAAAYDSAPAASPKRSGLLGRLFGGKRG
jgi:amino acid adenylation domain-containing protein